MYNEGQRLFGENYLQEALPKIKALPQDIEWHFIGTIQRNKTKKIAEHFAWVQSVANVDIAQRLNNQRPIHLPSLNICIEVNINNEPSKSGVLVKDVLPLAVYCLTLPRLSLRGIMAIPEKTDDFKLQRHSFNQLSLLYESLRRKKIDLDTLSMGTSQDFEAAVAEGSTMVRIGGDLFEAIS
jgi:hypothetical protein